MPQRILPTPTTIIHQHLRLNLARHDNPHRKPATYPTRKPSTTVDAPAPHLILNNLTNKPINHSPPTPRARTPMPELQSQRGQHFAFIDHIRGLAALAV